MTQRNPEHWMNGIIGPDTIKVDGEQIAVARKSINLVGATQADNPETDATDVTVGSDAIVVADGGTTSANIRADRDAAVQSPIDNTKDGIVNLGSISSDSYEGALGDYATIGGGLNAEATSSYCTVAGGENCSIRSESNDAHHSTISGGDHNGISEAVGATIAGGVNNTILGSCTGAVISGGQNGTVGAQYGIIPGGLFANIERTGQFAHSAGCFADAGDAQFSRYLMRGESVNGAAVALHDELGTPDCLVGNGKAYQIRITCIALNIGTGDVASFERIVQVKRSPVGTTTIVHDVAGANNTTLLNGLSWTFALSLVTNKLRATFTGESAQTIRASAVLEWAEIGSWS